MPKPYLLPETTVSQPPLRYVEDLVLQGPKTKRVAIQESINRYIKPIPPYNAICNILMDLGLPKDIANIIYTYANDVHWQVQQMVNKDILIWVDRIGSSMTGCSIPHNDLWFYVKYKEDPNNSHEWPLSQHPYRFNHKYKCYFKGGPYYYYPPYKSYKFEEAGIAWAIEHKTEWAKERGLC